MSLVALASAKGSPGVTTSALALAAVWDRPVLLAECDPAGGDIVAGYLRGQVEPSEGLLELGVAARRGATAADVLSRSLRLDDAGVLSVLPGLSDPAQSPALAQAWGPLVEVFVALGEGASPVDVIADCGRLAPAPLAPSELLGRADLVVLVLRPTLTQVRHARTQLAVLRRELRGGVGRPATLGVLLVGDRPYPRSDVALALDVPVLGVLPDDPGAAAVLSGQATLGRRFDRSPLIRTARGVAMQLRHALTAPVEHAVREASARVQAR